MTLREVLHAHIPTLSPESTLRDAIDKMDVYQFPALVIVDSHQAVLAVITEGDVCRAISVRENLVELADEPALSFATREPTAATPDMEIANALHLMLGSGLTVLPVIERGRLIGIVLRVDLMQAMLIDVLPASKNDSETSR